MMSVWLLTAMASLVLSGRTTKDPPLYAVNEEMTFTVRLTGQGDRSADGLYLDWKRTGDDGKTATGRAPLANPFVYRTSLDRPGFVRLEGRLTDESGSPVRTGEKGREAEVICDLGAGADIARIRPAVPAPDDFDAFWRKRRDRLAATPWRGREELKEVESNDASVRVFAVKVPCVAGVEMTGYLAVPRQPGKYPACAYFHGYYASFNGQHTQPPSTSMLQRLANGRVLLSVSPHGFELGREDAYYSDFLERQKSNGHGHGFDPVQNADPERPYYSSMSYRVLRAIDYLKSRTEWNGRDMTVTGGSQGGLQSIWCAGLDPAVTDCDIFIPWNCDIGGTERGRNRGSWYVKWVPGLGYYDACGMASRIPKSCRVTVTMAGLGDYVCPPTGVMAFYNSVTAPKTITFLQNAQHGSTLEPDPQSFMLEGGRLSAVNGKPVD